MRGSSVTSYSDGVTNKLQWEDNSQVTRKYEDSSSVTVGGMIFKLYTDSEGSSIEGIGHKLH